MHRKFYQIIFSPVFFPAKENKKIIGRKKKNYGEKIK